MSSLHRVAIQVSLYFNLQSVECQYSHYIATVSIYRAKNTQYHSLHMWTAFTKQAILGADQLNSNPKCKLTHLSQASKCKMSEHDSIWIKISDYQDKHTEKHRQIKLRSQITASVLLQNM
jgi:hypothetical protein